MSCGAERLVMLLCRVQYVLGCGAERLVMLLCRVQCVLGCGAERLVMLLTVCISTVALQIYICIGCFMCVPIVTANVNVETSAQDTDPYL
jgi:hypothetical protein